MYFLVQVNLCQKLLFLHQLTHNMTTDCSLNYKFNTWKFQAQTWGEHVVYRNCFWPSEQFLYTTCSSHVLQKEELLTKIYLYKPATHCFIFNFWALETPICTGKSLSEALLFAEHWENMLCTKIVLNVRNNFCTQHVLPRFELGIFMYWTCNSMNNLLSYYGLVDAKIRASDKD